MSAGTSKLSIGKLQISTVWCVLSCNCSNSDVLEVITYGWQISYVCHVMLCKHGLSLAVMRCLSVCLSVTFVNCVQTNKHIFNIVTSSGGHTILVFVHQMLWQYSDEDILTGASNTRGVGKSRLWAWLHCVLSTLQPARCYQHDDAGLQSRKLWHLLLVVSGRACWWQETTTRSLNVTPKTAEQCI